MKQVVIPLSYAAGRKIRELYQLAQQQVLTVIHPDTDRNNPKIAEDISHKEKIDIDKN